MRKMNRKGQLTLEDAPQAIVLVGLVFLIMATLALVASEYGDAFPSDEDGTVDSESTTRTEIGVSGGHSLSGAGQENAGSFALVGVTNTSEAIENNNFSLSAAGALTNTSSLELYGPTYNVNYTYTYSGVAANVTTDLTTEIGNNTSIAGIILTISLVGIVLTVLIGIFVGFRNRRV